MDALEKRVDALVREREAARQARDFARADALRERIMAISTGRYRVTILDEPSGPFWYWTTS